MLSKRNTLLALMTSVMASSSAMAGGFGTEGVNTAGALFNYKSFVVQGSVAGIFPERNYTDGVGTRLPGVPAAGSANIDAGKNLFRWDLEVKAALNDEIDCLGRLHQPYQLDTDATGHVSQYSQSAFEIESQTAELTCSYKFDINEKMLVRAIGGVRALWFDTERSNISFTGPITGDATNTFKLDNDGPDFGYRIGASFEIPEYLFRAQVFYDSAIDMSLSGTQTLGTQFFTQSFNIRSSVELPQSVTARVQSAVSETTLVWAGVRWEDWSSLKSIDIQDSFIGTGIGVNRLTTNFSDGWIVEVGAGHKLTDELSLSGSVTWNKGIDGGYTDTWSFGTGVAYDIDENWRVSVGGSATLLTSSNETSTNNTTGATTSYRQDSDWAFATGLKLQYAIK